MSGLNAFKSGQCGLCGAPIGKGYTGDGSEIAIDLRAAVYGLIGDKPLKLVRTEMAAVAHSEVCPYRDV